MNVDLEALQRVDRRDCDPDSGSADMFDKHPYSLVSTAGIDSMDRDPIFDFQAGEDVTTSTRPSSR